MGKYISEEARQKILNEPNSAWRSQTMDKVFWELYDKYKAGEIDSDLYYEACKHHREGGKFADDFLAMLIEEDNAKEEEQRAKKINRQWEAFSGKKEAMPKLPTPDIFILTDKKYKDIRYDIVIVYPESTGIPPISLTKCGLFNIKGNVVEDYMIKNVNMNLEGIPHRVEVDDIEEIDYSKLDIEAIRNEHRRVYDNYLRTSENPEEPVTPIIYKDDTK